MTEQLFYNDLSTTGLLILVIFAIFFVSFIINVLIVKFLRTRVEPSFYKFVSRILTYIIFIVGLSVALNKVVQFNFGATLATLGILGGLLLLPLVPILQNIASGFILSFERPFKEEDYIELSGKICKVKEINLRKTILRSLNGEIITAPNLMFMTGTPVVNYTTGEFIRIIQVIEISGNSELSKAKQIIENVCLINADILPHIPEKKKNMLRRIFEISNGFFNSPKNINKLKPRVFVKSVSKEKIGLEVWFWIWDITKKEQIISNFYELVINEFKKNEINFA